MPSFYEYEAEADAIDEELFGEDEEEEGFDLEEERDDE